MTVLNDFSEKEGLFCFAEDRRLVIIREADLGGPGGGRGVILKICCDEESNHIMKSMLGGEKNSFL